MPVVFFAMCSIHRTTTSSNQHLNQGANPVINKFAVATTVAALVTGAAYAQQTTGAGTPTQPQTLNSLPQNATTVTNYYKQNVYDPSDTKIGEIKDVLVSKEGKVDAFIVSVGGFLGVAEKDVAVPFDAIHATDHSRHREERKVVPDDERHQRCA